MARFGSGHEQKTDRGKKKYEGRFGVGGVMRHIRLKGRENIGGKFCREAKPTVWRRCKKAKEKTAMKVKNGPLPAIDLETEVTWVGS